MVLLDNAIANMFLAFYMEQSVAFYCFHVQLGLCLTMSWV